MPLRKQRAVRAARHAWKLLSYRAFRSFTALENFRANHQPVSALALDQSQRFPPMHAVRATCFSDRLREYWQWFVCLSRRSNRGPSSLLFGGHSTPFSKFEKYNGHANANQFTAFPDCLHSSRSPDLRIVAMHCHARHSTAWSSLVSVTRMFLTHRSARLEQWIFVNDGRGDGGSVAAGIALSWNIFYGCCRV